MLRSRAITLICGILFLQCLSVVTALSARGEVLIAANGGVLEEAPENTIYAYELAVAQGAKVIKVDVRGTKDGEAVIIKDATIDRTTNGRGFVGDLFLEEIKIYDAGSWLDKRFEGEVVPMLREVLRFAKINDLKVILDVKEQGLETGILALVESLGMMKKVYFWGVMSNLREIEPSLVGPDLMFITPEELTAGNIEQAHSQHKDVMTSLLNCDDMGKMREVMKKGPDIILVDFPAVASEALGSKQKRRAIRRIQKRSPLVTVPFDGRKYSRPEDEMFLAETGRSSIDLLDPIGTLHDLLLGVSGGVIDEMPASSSREASLRKEVRELNRDLHEPGMSERGFFGKFKSKLIKGMSDEEADESRMAALEMTSLPFFAVVPQLVNALNSKRAAVRDNAVWALGLIGDYSVMPGIAGLLVDKNEEVEVRRDAAIAFGRFRQTGATILLREELVEGDIPPVRYDVARALGEIGDATVVGDMIRVMDDGGVDWRIKGACAGALGEIGDPSAVTGLGKLLMENTGQPFSVWTRYRAAWALSSMGEDSLMVLLTALRDDEELIRRKSAWALIRIGPPAIPTLVRALRDPYARVRERAAMAMGWIGDSKAIPSLVRSIYDEDFKVRQAVVWAIGHIGGVRADKVLAELVDSDDDERIKEMAGEAIAKKSKKYKGSSR